MRGEAHRDGGGDLFSSHHSHVCEVHYSMIGVNEERTVRVNICCILHCRHAHKHTVMEVQWNRNGNWLLTASRDHLLKLFDVRNMKEELQSFKGHRKEATSEWEDHCSLILLLPRSCRRDICRMIVEHVGCKVAPYCEALNIGGPFIWQFPLFFPP